MCMNLVIIVIGSFIRVLQRLFMRAVRFTPHVVRVHAHPRVSFLISFFISLLSVGVLMIIMILASTSETNNYALAQDALRNCTPLPKPAPSPHTVILRLDDVQAGTWTDISTTMMSDTIKRGMPIVAGVIPLRIGTSIDIQRYFKSYGCNTEVALHGYTHADSQYDYERDHGSNPEFGRLSKHATRKKLTAAFEELRSIPAGPVVTFIPPENRISEAASAVLGEYGIRYLSKEGNGPYDYTASTWNYDSDHYVPAKLVLKTCADHFAAGGTLCVIMLHPQDYANPDGTLNDARYKDYLVLIDTLETSSYTVTTFRDLSPEETSQL